MSLDNSIDNRVAGFIWLGIGAIGVYWLNGLSETVRREVGGWWKYFFGPEPGNEARAKVVGVQKRLWAFVAAWLALYVLLDWLF